MRLIKNQRGYTEIVSLSIILGIIGSIFITGVFIWQEINSAKKIAEISKYLEQDNDIKEPAQLNNMEDKYYCEEDADCIAATVCHPTEYASY